MSPHKVGCEMWLWDNDVVDWANPTCSCEEETVAPINSPIRDDEIHAALRVELAEREKSIEAYQHLYDAEQGKVTKLYSMLLAALEADQVPEPQGGLAPQRTTPCFLSGNDGWAAKTCVTLIRDGYHCTNCEGCGRVADSESGEPWTHWLTLPLGSAAAVITGIVKPKHCPECRGLGIRRAP